MLLFHLLDRNHFAAEVGELGKLLLNGLEPFVPLSVSYLSLSFIRFPEPVLLIQFLNVSDFGTQPTYFFPKHIEVVHTTRIAYLGTPEHAAPTCSRIGLIPMLEF